MIIEFLGVSGVGKTTVASVYKRKLESEGKTVVWDTYDLYANKGWLSRNISKAVCISWYALSNWHWVQQYAAYLQKNEVSFRQKIKPLFNGIFLKLLLVKAKQDKRVHFFDEGSMQYLWAIKLRGKKHCTNDDIEKIETLFGLPDVLIVVTASSETIMNRLLSRGEYTEIMNSGSLLESIIEMSIVCHEIEAKVSSIIQTAIIENNGESITDIEKLHFPY